MIRTFQAKTTIKQYALLAVLLSVVVCFYWMSIPKRLLGALLALLLLLITVIISRMIGTFYIVHSTGCLEIKRGRFTEQKRIQLQDIKQIDQVRRSGTLIIITNDDKEYYLIPPKNVDDFIKCIEKYRNQQEIPDDEED